MMSFTTFCLLPGVMAVQVADHHQPAMGAGADAIVGIRESLLAIAKKGNLDETTIRAVEGFMQTINGTLFTAIEQDKQHAQGLYDASVASVNQCEIDQAAYFADTLPSLNITMETSYDDLIECKVEENETLSSLEDTCQALRDRACHWTICEVPNFDNGDSEEVDAYMCCLQDFFDLHRVDYYIDKENCTTKTNEHFTQGSNCDANQTEFEAAVCTFEQGKISTCETYDACYPREKALWEGVKADIEAMEQIFQAQFVALHHLLCYGQQILDNATDLTSCDTFGNDCEADYTDCPEIVYTEPDVENNCIYLDYAYPCTEEFFAKFYDDDLTTALPGFDMVRTPAGDCTPCDAMDDGLPSLLQQAEGSSASAMGRKKRRDYATR